jgi:hypothetical protein
MTFNGEMLIIFLMWSRTRVSNIILKRIPFTVAIESIKCLKVNLRKEVKICLGKTVKQLKDLKEVLNK